MTNFKDLLTVFNKETSDLQEQMGLERHHVRCLTRKMNESDTTEEEFMKYIDETLLHMEELDKLETVYRARLLCAKWKIESLKFRDLLKRSLG